MGRTEFAIGALTLAALVQVVLLIDGAESAAWSIITIVLLLGACLALLRSRER